MPGHEADDAAPLPSGEVTVSGRTYTKCDCYLKAVMLDDSLAFAWSNLGGAMTANDVVQFAGSRADKKKAAAAAATAAAAALTGSTSTSVTPTVSALAGGGGASSVSPSPGALPLEGGAAVPTQLLTRSEVLSKAVELDPTSAAAWLHLGLLGSFDPPAFRAANPKHFANNLSTASTSSQHDRNDALGTLGVPTVRIGGDEITQMDCFVAAAEADPSRTLAWMEIARRMSGGGDGGAAAPLTALDAEPTCAEDLTAPAVIEVGGEVFTKAAIEARIMEIRTPAHPHQTPLAAAAAASALPPLASSKRA